MGKGLSADVIKEAGADKRAPHVSVSRESVHRGPGPWDVPPPGTGTAQAGPAERRLAAARPLAATAGNDSRGRWRRTRESGGAVRQGGGGNQLPGTTGNGAGAEGGGSDPVGRPPAAAAHREDALEVADEGEEKGEGRECSTRGTTAKGQPTARTGGGGAPQEDDATELRRRASLGKGRTGSASI
uniref:Uncharacterized protein n=1 Tax=Oryza sativa subsp. japonica TaxID=39947 RepID=Q6Z0S4_ORYSJ|nr:hypothetical protein [Oryza sativa Japonica Group]BAD33023.1 hypothetical protein [Oryza sativa Japonica Group]